LILATNDLDTPASVIAQHYKDRWQIELFFKWIKQHLKIKRFLGRARMVFSGLSSALPLFCTRPETTRTTPAFLNDSPDLPVVRLRGDDELISGSLGREAFRAPCFLP
jgi:hypothetical protein